MSRKGALIMHDIWFCYQPEDNSWHECHHEAAAADIGTLPVILVVKYSHQRTREKWEKAWCEKHQAYEDIKSYGDCSLTTDAGCQLTGFIARVSASIYQTSSTYDWPSSRQTIRWHLQHDNAEDTVYLISDSIEVFYSWRKETDGSFLLIPSTILRNSHSQSFNIGAHEQPEHIYGLSGFVLEKLMEVLHEKARHIYGDDIRLLLPPTDSLGYDSRWRWDSRACEWLLALLHRPLDMSIYFFRKYFKDDKKFNELFPRNQRHNFLLLAQTLGLAPTEELKQEYEKNPLSLIFHLMLPELGIRDKQLIRKFFSLQAFCGYMMKEGYKNELFFDPLQVGPKDYLPDEAPADYDSLRFYCLWRLQHTSETELAEYLLDKQKDWRSWKYSSLKAFQKYFEQLPADLKAEILKDGISPQVHDQLMLLRQHYSSKKADTLCGEKELARECKINDYNFRLICSIVSFYYIVSRSMQLPSTNLKDFTGKALYVIERNGRYLGVIQVNGNLIEHYTFCDSYDDILQAKTYIAFLAWARHHQLTRNYCGRDDSTDAMKQDFTIEPPDRTEWDTLSLKEMMELPHNSLRPGFFLNLYRKFTEVPLLRPPAPSHSDAEEEYLSRNFPWGKTIYQAAFADQPEAQYVMSLLYRDNYCLSPDLTLSEKWYLRAVSNGWLEMAPAKKDVRIAFSSP